MLFIARLAVPAVLLMLLIGPWMGGAARAQGAYSDAKLQSYVEAAIQVGALMEQYKPRVDAAISPERAAALRAEAKGKMDAAIDRTPGITIDEYIEILLAARSDPTLHGRIDTLYRAAKER
jgi:hypothetical protein